MKKCVMIPVLTLCLLLTACGSRKIEAEKAAGDMDEAEILLTVDGRDVPAWRYLCWLTYACDRVKAQYAAAGQELDWQTEIEGGTLTDYVKGKALADTVLYATVENWAERYGCEVSPEDAPEQILLPLTGLSGEQTKELWAVGQMYAALYDLYCTEGSVLAPAQEQLAAYGEETGVLTLDRILISAGEDREKARQRAAEYFSRLNSAEAPAEIFSELAAEGDDTAGPRQANAVGWSEELLEAGRSLEEGQCSGIPESEEGFSILLRVKTDPESLKESHFDFLLQAAAETAAVMLQPRYETLSPADFLSSEGTA